MDDEEQSREFVYDSLRLIIINLECLSMNLCIILTLLVLIFSLQT